MPSTSTHHLAVRKQDRLIPILITRSSLGTRMALPSPSPDGEVIPTSPDFPAIYPADSALRHQLERALGLGQQTQLLRVALVHLGGEATPIAGLVRQAEEDRAERGVVEAGVLAGVVLRVAARL